MRSCVVFAFSLLHIVVANPFARRWDDVRVKHGWDEVPSGWVVHSDAPAEHVVKLRIALKQDRFDELVDHLYEVSNPANARYGAHLSKEEVDALVAPHEQSVELVNAWLEHHGIDQSHGAIERSDVGDMLSIMATIEQAERLLATKYNIFHHPETDSYVVRTKEYNLPDVLHGHISMVSPTTYFGNAHRLRAEKRNVKRANPDTSIPTSCNETITPTCLADLYKTSNYFPRVPGINQIGVVDYHADSANNSDLQLFFKNYKPIAQGTKFISVGVNGGFNNQSHNVLNGDSNIEITEGLTWPTPNILYSVAGTPPFTPDDTFPDNTNEPYLDFLQYILKQVIIPQTISSPYFDDEQTVPEDYATTVCNLFAQLGARGVSVLVPSSGPGQGDCVSNDGSGTVRFQPVFPASCPFVTTVGGTTQVPEIALEFGGGGFSDIFQRPAYQNAAVEKYLKGLGSQLSGLYNPNGRAFPDVSAQGLNYAIYAIGILFGLGGTSTSTCTFASVVSLLNDYRISIGKPPLGFLNPLLYSSGISGLNDIVAGGPSQGCGVTAFSTAVGWDPLTGLGTPDFVKLQQIVTVH